MKSTAVRLTLSVILGVVTFHLIGMVLRSAAGGSWVFDRYCDVFGVATLVGRAVDSHYTGGEGVLDASVGEHAALAVMIGFWSLLFAALYFRYVFRSHATI